AAAGTRCEHVRVRSPSPSMAQDGPGSRKALPMLQTRCQLAGFSNPRLARWMDAAREPTGMYSRRVPQVCASTQARTQRATRKRNTWRNGSAKHPNGEVVIHQQGGKQYEQVGDRVTEGFHRQLRV